MRQMNQTLDSPIIFEPILKQILWGGRRLGTLLGKKIGSESNYAESWEIADHPHGQSVVAWPERLKGMKLSDLVHDRPAAILGQSFAEKSSQFPLLIKFLDAHQVLSLQVHPDDALARKLLNDNGKNEAWVILHAEPDSRIYAGLNPGVTRDQFAEALAHQKVADLVHWFEPKPGDCIMIPAGTVHAIGAGIVLAEIQQMSDATFRVDDWGRVGPDGSPRQLHLKEALLATDFNRGPVGPWQPRIIESQNKQLVHEELARCNYFTIDRLSFTGSLQLGDSTGDCFTILIVTRGCIQIAGSDGEIYEAGPGSTILLPASLKTCEVIAVGDDHQAQILTCRLPDKTNQN